MRADKEASAGFLTKEYYEHMAHQIGREDGLINARITWMLTFEGFLFATLALVGVKDKARPELYNILKFVLPILGAAIGLMAYLSVEAALSALKSLKDGWKRREKELGVAGVYPRAFAKEWPHFWGSLQSRLLPLAVVAAWVIIWLSLN